MQEIEVKRAFSLGTPEIIANAGGPQEPPVSATTSGGPDELNELAPAARQIPEPGHTAAWKRPTAPPVAVMGAPQTGPPPVLASAALWVPANATATATAALSAIRARRVNTLNNFILLSRGRAAPIWLR